jgi:hypothetical protein
MNHQRAYGRRALFKVFAIVLIFLNSIGAAYAAEIEFKVNLLSSGFAFTDRGDGGAYEFSESTDCCWVSVGGSSIHDYYFAPPYQTSAYAFAFSQTQVTVSRQYYDYGLGLGGVQFTSNAQAGVLARALGGYIDGYQWWGASAATSSATSADMSIVLDGRYRYVYQLFAQITTDSESFIEFGPTGERLSATPGRGVAYFEREGVFEGLQFDVRSFAASGATAFAGGSVGGQENGGYSQAFFTLNLLVSPVPQPPVSLLFSIGLLAILLKTAVDRRTSR